MKSHINVAGIALSTMGAFLIWYFVAEINFADKKAYVQGK